MAGDFQLDSFDVTARFRRKQEIPFGVWCIIGFFLLGLLVACTKDKERQEHRPTCTPSAASLRR